MANTNLDIILSSMGRSQDPNFDDILSGMGSSQPGGPSVPGPVFATQPTISPSTGTANSTTYTATPGTVTGGSITSRAWLLNGTAISSGLTALPTTDGTLTYQEFASGAGGSASSVIRSATVSAVAPTPTPSVTYQQLGVSPQAFTAGAPAGTVIGTISGKTADSTISVTDDRLAVNAGGTQLLVGVTTSADNAVINANLVETGSNATNSGRVSAISITANAAAQGAATVTQFSDIVASSPWYGGATDPNPRYDATSGKVLVAVEGINPAISTRRSSYMYQWDPATLAIQGPARMFDSALTNDDHGVVGWCILPSNRRAYGFGGTHGGSFQWGISAANDYQTWVSQTPIAPTDGTNGYCYPHPMPAGSKIWLGARKTVNNTQSYPLVVLPGPVASDGSVAWAAEIPLVDFGNNTRVYQISPQIISTSGDNIVSRLFFCMADGPDSYRQDVFVAIFDSAANTLSNLAGTNVRNLGTSGPLPLVTARANYRFTMQQEQGLYTTALANGIDTAGNIHIAYAEDADDNSTANAVIDIKWQMLSPTGAVLAGPTTITQTQQRYDGIELVTMPNGQMDLIFTSADAYGFARGGNISKVSRPSGGTWSAPTTVQVASSSMPLDRPFAVKNGTANARYVFGENAIPPYQGNTGGADNQTFGNIRTFAVGDSGVIQFPFTPHPKTQAWAARCQTPPNTSQMKRVDALIRNTVLSVPSLVLDALYLIGGQTVDEAQACSLDLIGTRDLVIGSGMTFAQVAGQIGYAWKGNGTGATMDTGFIPSTAGGKMALNSASLSAYVLSEGQDASTIIDVASGNTGGITFFNPRDASDKAQARLNSGAASSLASTNTTAKGFYIARRTAANSVQQFKDGTQIGSGTAASSSLPTTQLTLFGAKGGTATSIRQIACVGFGGGIGLADIDAFAVGQLRYLRDSGLIT